MIKEEPCKIEIQGEWTMERYASFQMLYVPLIGVDAAILYHTLLSVGSRPQKIKNHILLVRISGLSIERIEKTRPILEQFLLIKTFYHGANNRYIYQVFMPKYGEEFLRHEVFGRLYLKQMGKQVYDFNKISFSKASEDISAYQDITIPFVNTLRSDWEDKQEELFQTSKPKQTSIHQNDIPLQFNYDRFLSELSQQVFPNEARNERNLRLIGELATIHGIDEIDMRKLVSRSINIKTRELNTQLLKEKARNAKTVYESSDEKNPYQMPPVRFLQAKQKGIAVSKGDKFLIESLITEFKMKPEVVNVLIEYVLTVKQMQFPKAYVEKIASTWVRLEIDTYEKALAQSQQEQPGGTYVKQAAIKELPTWYHDQSDMKPQQTYDEKQLEENLKKLRGE